MRTVIDLSSDWRFSLTDQAEAKEPKFSDEEWATLDVPHDWAFEAGVSEDGAQKDKGGYYSGGIGWYRKSFTAPDLAEGQTLQIHFDGVYMDSQVFLNGALLGVFRYGYLSFSYDLTEHLKKGENVIAVRVDNSKEPSARWYHPCGIYAPVRLEIRPEEHVKSVFVTTPTISDELAEVNLDLEYEGGSDLVLSHAIIDPVGKKTEFKKGDKLKIAKPQRWGLENPVLYTLVSRLHREGVLVDEVETRFGVRSIKWEAKTGFHLNGKVTKLLGVCEHWEGGPVGGAWTDDLLRWKLQLLKDMGCNAIRTSHNPFPPVFYDLCDEMGFLVMDEIFDGWIKKAPQDYGARFFDENWKKDLESWVRRDRNHPSVVIYSVGNETRGKVAPDLVAAIRALDPTRPVTSGHSGSEHMDVYGVNGTSEKQSFYTKYKRPKHKAFIATEAPHTWQVRGFYRSKSWFRDGFPNKRQSPFPLPDLTEEEIFTYSWTAPEGRKNRKQIFNSSYDNAMVRITARKNWEIMRDTPWYAGHFRWTGYDYPGEAGYVHGGWPFRAFMGGALDLAGFEKDLFYFYQAQWTKEPMVHLLPHWSHPKMKAGTQIPVWAYSNAEEVELFLNGKSLGIDRPGTKAEEMQCEWMVPWEPGTLVAVARRGGQEVARTEQVTAGAPFALDLETEVVGDHRVLTTSLVDEKGTLSPYSDNRVYYHFEGVDFDSHENGNPVDVENGNLPASRRAFMGKTRSFLKVDEEKLGAVLAAGILGSRNGVTGDSLVNIVVENELFGNLEGRHWMSAIPKIYYTIDGSEPTRESSLFEKPFEVKLPTTVRALVVMQDREVFQMEERFAESEGLHWAKHGAVEELNENYLQAEAGQLSGKAKVVKVSAKLSCVDFPKGGGELIIPLGNNGIPGKTTLNLVYGQQAGKGSRKLTLFVNDQKLRTLTFKNTGSWHKDWKVLATEIPLAAGANEVKLVAHAEGGPSLDKIFLKD